MFDITVIIRIMLHIVSCIPFGHDIIVIISICVCLFGHQQDHNYIIKPCCSNVYILALTLSAQLCEKFILKSILCAKRIYATLRIQCDISDVHTLDTISLQIVNMCGENIPIY